MEQIPANLCRNMSKLTSITIPESVTSIDDRAFSGCTGLTSITWNARNCEVYNWEGEDPALFQDAADNIETFVFGDSVEQIPAGLCSGLSGLTSVTIPSSVTSIGYGAFDGCTGLTSVTISEGVTRIGDDAFRDCTGLTSVTIPASVKLIGGYNVSSGGSAFSGCTGLTSITWNARNCKAYNWEEENLALFQDAADNIETFVFGDSVEQIPANLCRNMSKLTSITIPSSVTSIGGSAFEGCTGLTSVTIPPSVTSIDDRAFSGCSGLTEITILEGVTSIGNYVFWGCSGLTEITIPEGVTSIGNYAFWGMRLESVISQASTPPEIWTNTFDDFYMPLYVPAGSKVKYQTANYWRNFINIQEIGVTQYRVDVFSSDDSMGSVMGSGEYAEGSEVTLAAIPANGYRFVRWNDGNTENPRRVTVTGDMTFVAEFELDGSAVESPGNDAMRVYVVGRTLHVENNTDTYRVYTATGQLVYMGNDTTVSLADAGVYLVRTGERSQKVIVK